MLRLGLMLPLVMGAPVAGGASPPVVTTIEGVVGGPYAGAAISAAFTPANNSLLVAFVWATDGGLPCKDNLGVQDSLGGTWTQRVTAGAVFDANRNVGLRVFTRPVTTGASMTVSAYLTSGGSPEATELLLHQITGHNAASPVGVTVASNALNAETGAMTLPGSPATSSTVLAARSLTQNGGETCSATPGAGWTETLDLSSPDRGGAAVQYRSGSTSTAIAWTDANASNATDHGALGVALEIKGQ